MTRRYADSFNSFYPEIGKTIVAWSLLEIEIDAHLIALLHNPKAVAVLAVTPINPGRLLPRSFSKRVELWKRLARLHYTSGALTDLRAIIGACNTLKKERDGVAHGEWVIEHSAKYKGDVVAYRHREGIKEAGRRVTTKMLKALHTAMEKTRSDIVIFNHHYHPEGPLPIRLRRFLRALPSRFHRGGRALG